ncbi:MAG: hypothetical protein ACR2N7_07155 [Acidimicrobiia bacterium]
MTTDDSIAARGSEAGAHRKAERLSHALYGLIIITATLVAEQAHVTEVADAMGLLLGTALVLLLAHTYSAAMAERAIERGSLGSIGRRMVVEDNLPVLLAVVFPAVLFVLAGADVMSLSAAYTASIVFSLLALFAIGIRQGRVADMAWPTSILSGLAAGMIGLIVVAFEAFFE